MPYRTLMIITLFGLPLAGLAETPNIEPGQWEYVNETKIESDFPIPDQTHTSTDCVTLEDIERGDAFLEDVEDCEMTRQDMRRDGMEYSMVCRDDDGSEITMNAEMSFMGDRVNGTMRAEVHTPMGPMLMTVDINGRRIGDC